MEKRRHSNRHIHVPTPGDHYTFQTGSAIITLVYEFSRKHVEAGGSAQIIVARSSTYDYDAGECVPVDFAPYPTPNQKIADVLLARLGMQRHFINKTYEAAVKGIQGIDPDFDGTVFIQNTPAPVWQFKKALPNAQVCVNVCNSLFHTYDQRELHRTVDAADLVLFNCDFLANEIRARLKRGHEKLRVVHNGVDTKRFVPRPDLAPKDEVVILFVARMVPTKGADLLIRAARKIHGKTRRFKLRIVGRETFDVNFPLSPFELEVRKLAEPLGDCVEFIPFLDRHKILPVYQSASIFCAPSNYDEPCTLALPEAMSCGVASIASRRGGIPEVGRDAIHYFDPPEIDELAEHLAYLIEDEEARIEWGRRARAQAEAMDWAIQYRTLIKAIGTTGAEAPRPAAISAKPLQPSTLRK